MPKTANDTNKNNYAFIKKLAANDRPTRDSALEHLKQFLKTSKTLDSLECQKLWRGLFFTMWHSDRPRTQQALAANMASLLDIIKPKNLFTFIDAFWKIMAREWDALDRHRIDKFYLLIRCYVNRTFVRLQAEDWNEELVKKYADTMKKGPLTIENQKIPNAFPLHLCDIYLDELEKVFGDILTEDEDPKEVLHDIPLSLIVSPIEQLKEHPSKVVSKHVIQTFLKDKRLELWGVKEEKNENDNEDDESEDEWNGFE